MNLPNAALLNRLITISLIVSVSSVGSSGIGKTMAAEEQSSTAVALSSGPAVVPIAPNLAIAGQPSTADLEQFAKCGLSNADQ